MPRIEITRVGTSDLSTPKRNFAGLLQEKLGAKEPMTLIDAVAKLGLTDKQVQTSAKRRARYVSTAQETRRFPTVHEVQHRLTIEAQGPLVTYDGDGGFSSRGLTDWYVSLFCTSINDIKGQHQMW